MTVATNTHIVIDDQGNPRIEGAWFKVKFIAIYTQMGMSPLQIQEGFPSLTLSQIHSALAYYYDHKSEMDTQLEAEDGEADQLRAKAVASGTQPTRAELERRLREQGKTL